VGGKPKDPGYFRAWRRRHPEYVERERARLAKRDRTGQDRTAERARARARAKPATPSEPILPVYPALQHGRAVSFWEDELRIDLAQERALAELEGRDPAAAVRAYRLRETQWMQRTVPIVPEL
jgi:hypothetical protein